MINEQMISSSHIEQVVEEQTQSSLEIEPEVEDQMIPV